MVPGVVRASDALMLDLPSAPAELSDARMNDAGAPAEDLLGGVPVPVGEDATEPLGLAGLLIHIFSID